MKINKIFLSIMLLAFVVSSCEEEFLETAPTDQLEAGTMFESLEGAEAALNGMYRYMYVFDPVYGNHDAFGHMAVNVDMGMLGQDMVGHVLAHGWFGQMYAWRVHRNADGGMTQLRWYVYYKVILNANMIITNAPQIEEALPSDVNRLVAQAKGARAFAYYQLAQLYAPAYHVNPDAPAVPIYTEPSEEGNPRSSLREVYEQIETDLDQAIELFDGSTAQVHKSHISLPVIHGLYARTALSKGEWDVARQHAETAINLSGASLFTVDDFPPRFEGLATYSRNQLFNNVGADEWMWGMEINEEQATIFASFFSHMDPLTFSYAQLGNQKLISHGEEGLYHRMSDTDVRKNLWADPEYAESYVVPYCQLKFVTQRDGSWEGDYVFMRLAEMYLIKAEAEARDGQHGDAAQTLYELMQHRDPEYELSTNTGQELIDEIMFHRRVELWGEGFNWIDLKRTGQPLDRRNKGHSEQLAITLYEEADTDRWLWLIPTDEINANDAISSGDQNP